MYKNGHAKLASEDLYSIGEPVPLPEDQYIPAYYDTPLRPDAFDLNDNDKIRIIETHFKEIMLTLGLDLADDSLKNTPQRFAHMYVKELFSGLDPRNKPDITLFDNKYTYDQMLVEKNICFHSYCEHHFVPIIGKAHVAYISSGKVIGLSKINRVVHYLASRPQVQERLTVQIAHELSAALNTKDIAVVLDASHLCVSSRGVKDRESGTVTAWYGGRFKKEEIKNEFLSFIR